MRSAYHDLDLGMERKHLVEGREAAWAIGRNDLAKGAMLQDCRVISRACSVRCLLLQLVEDNLTCC